MDVSTERPSFTAVTLAPLPRWHEMMRSDSNGLSISAATASRHVLVGNAVEAVAANVQPLVQFVRNAVQIRVPRHVGVERRVKHRHLGYAGKKVRTRVNARDVVGIVQRSQLAELDERLLDAVGDQNRVAVQFAAVHHPVADGVDVAVTVVGRGVVRHHVEGQADGVAMLEHRPDRTVPPAPGFMDQQGLLGADALDAPRGQHRLGFAGAHVEELVLDRRTAAV